jgi:hypothetical protein
MERQRYVQMRPVHEVSWPPPRRSGSRRLLVIALALLLPVLAAGYTAWWFHAATEFGNRTLDWIENRRADGWRLAYVDVSRRGFPLQLGLRFDKPVVGAPAGDWTWAVSSALLSTRVFDPQPLRLAIKGDQAMEFGDALSAGEKRRSYSGSADEFTVDLVPGGWLPNGHLRVRDLAVAGDSASDGFGIARLDLVSRGDPAAAPGPEVSSYAMELTAGGFRLPVSEAVPLCHEVAHLAFDAKLFGALEPRPWPTSIAEWREAGGVVEATRLVLVCGPLTLDGEGTFALDSAGQLIGAMTTRIQGYEAALDRLTADQAIPAHAAATAKIVLRALARSGGEGVPTLVAPLSIQDRTLSVGPVPLLRLRPLHWLDGAAR